MKKFCICETFCIFVGYNTQNNAMKKKQMIEILLQEERRLWNDLQYCINTLGVSDDATEWATARWAVVHNLVQKIGLK